MSGQKILRYVLMAYLLIGAFVGFVLAVLNPESYFLGGKVAGAKATLHLMVNSLIAVFALKWIMEENPRGTIAALIYFGYNAIEVLLTNYLLGFGIIPSPFFTTGLVFTVIFAVRNYSTGNLS